MRLPSLLLVCLFTSSLPAAAAGPVLGSVPGGATITGDDLLTEVEQLSPQAQAQVLARPVDIANAVNNLLLQRELARRAEAGGLHNEPKVAAALRAARDKVLAEAALTRAAGEPPDRAALERLARNQYNAAPEKFEQPEQIRVRHILVDARACDAEARVKELLAAARAPGADFAALAKANSHDPASAERGGDLGFFARGRMAAPFDAAAFALKEPGQISDVVKTEFGYHIIRLEERRPAARQPFEAVRDGLIRGLADSEMRTRRREAADAIAATVKLDVPAIEAFYAARRAAPRPN